MLAEPVATVTGITRMQIIPRIPGDTPNITRRTIRDQISDKLAYMIHSGLLRPGDELPSERELATTLGVSRETVRAAIGVLQAWRMLEVSQGARTRVLGPGAVAVQDSVSTLRDLGDRSLEEVAEARAAVEIQVIRLATRRITPAQLNRLDRLVADQETMMDDPVRFQISDQEFHQVLYRACGNGLLADVVFDFYGYALEHRRRAMQRRGAIAHSVADHRAIVAALKNHDPETAVAAMQQHLDQVHRTTQQELDHS